MINRDACVVTGSRNLEELYIFRDFPVHQGTTDKPYDKDLRMDLIFDICKDSGEIQVRNLVPENVLYNQEHSRSIGGIWKRHHREFAAFISKYKPGSVYEIGGGIGWLETYYNDGRDEPLLWTILEPNAEPLDRCRAKYETGFFDENYHVRSEFDTLVFSHLFEHIYKPFEFMKHLSEEIEEGKRLIFSVPDMEAMLGNHQSNTLNYEHCYYGAEPYVDYMVTRNGFEILEKKKYEGHSIFYSTIRKHNVKVRQLDDNLYDRNKKLFIEYTDDYENFVRDVNEKIQVERPENLYLFGAHLFSQFLLGFGLDGGSIKGILDNDKMKHGKRLQGSHLSCYSPEVLREELKPVVIIRAGTYQNEIKEGILKINETTIFWE